KPIRAPTNGPSWICCETDLVARRPASTTSSATPPAWDQACCAASPASTSTFLAWLAAATVAAAASSTIFWAWPAAAAVAAVALFTCSPIASPASVTRASMLVASFEDVLLITVLQTTSFWHANFYSAAPAGDQPVAYLNSGSLLRPSLLPPGSVTLLAANLSVS